MNLRNISLSNIVLLLFLVAAVNSSCEDRLVDCSIFTQHCHIPAIMNNCLRTCNACDTDICLTMNGGCDQLCTSDGEDFECSCLPGYRLGNDSVTCYDIDECREGPNPCLPISNFYCINTVGSFECSYQDCSLQPGIANYYRSQHCCSVKNSDCGLSGEIRRLATRNDNQVEGRILNGEDATAGQWPWQAQITYESQSHCGAIIISNNWLLGAAHCFSSYQTSRMFVYMGHVRNAVVQTEFTERREQRRIARVIIHENYDNVSNDIALIELQDPVKFTNFISPVCLPCGELPEVGTKCWTTGFGTTEERQDLFPDYLQEIDVPIVSGDDCISSYRGRYPIDTNTMICAGYEIGEKDSCQGDSGGPLVCQRSGSCGWYLAGVTSFGIGCGRPSFYGVYVNVRSFEDWIATHVGRAELPECSNRGNECDGLKNVNQDCYTKLDYCARFPHYMSEKCELACCQLRTNEISNCFDTAGADAFCQLQKSLGCANSQFQSIIDAHCKLTCGLC